MGKYRIRGGHPLRGVLDIGGAKNAALPILAALCLNESEIEIHNCPTIADTFQSLEILRRIGCEVERDGTTVRVNCSGGLSHEIPDDIVGQMRSSILFMGAMLGRQGRVDIAMPGGCKLGARAIDLHLTGLAAMGAVICLEGDKFYCNAPHGLKGADIMLRSPSVGATENLILAATRAKGTTLLQNAAREPEIVNLADFLNSCGANITGAGSGTIRIDGVAKLHKPPAFTIMPDRIVAGTFLVAAAMTQGMITLRSVNTCDLLPVIESLRQMGCTIACGKNCVTLVAPQRLTALPELVTEVHPGFPTDMQAQFVAALAIAEGVSRITETIFESRHAHALDLNNMGAKIDISKDNRTFLIEGQQQLYGQQVAAQDLRGGAALILAALSAKGETVVENAHHVQRGYEQLEQDLSALGAAIWLE